jgi:hypothetical protein
MRKHQLICQDMHFKMKYAGMLSTALFLFASCATTQKPVSSLPIIKDSVVATIATTDVYNYHNDRVTSSFDLPAWLSFSDNNTTAGEIFTIGISDPNLDPTTANNQAVARAKLLASLLVGSKISDCKEIYTNETGKTHQTDNAAKFTRFQIIKTYQVFDDAQFQLVDSATSRYGEKIVLMKLFPDSPSENKTETIQSTIDVMLAEYNLRSKFQENRFLNCVHKISTPDFSEEASYRLYKVDEISDIVSTYNNKSISFKTDSYKYLLHDASQVPDYPVRTKLYYGLWKAVFESVVIQLANLNPPSEFALQTMRDDYQNENGNKSQSIDQQIHTIDFSGKITGFFISENELTLQIEKTKP